MRGDRRKLIAVALRRFSHWGQFSPHRNKTVMAMQRPHA